MAAGMPPATVPDDGGPAAGAWIAEAQRGSRDAVGRAVEGCRQYLLLIADREIDPALRPRGGASDLVQETMLVAQQKFGRFTGRTEAELRAWTRQILLNRLATFRRQHYGAAKRRVGLEVSLELHRESAEQAGGDTSVGGRLVQEERLRALRRAVEALPERARCVFLWKHQEGCTNEEIGRRLGVSAEAARKLWTRTIERLQADLGPLL